MRLAKSASIGGASCYPDRPQAKQAETIAMAKGQLRGNKEKKKPKADWNKKKKGAPAPSSLAAGSAAAARIGQGTGKK
ncbi:MAG TPA: hypothetical protein VK281_18605 [Xanthobacteraceae bacterium]|nr:hypothetical protein [Xanthobacteraceae bacterium]